MATQESIRALLKANGYEEMWGDVDLLYGATFLKASDTEPAGAAGWYDVIEIVDLDSACGADGQVMVTSRNTSFDYAHGKDLKRAVDCHGGLETLKHVARENKSDARKLLAVWLHGYGIADPNGYGDSDFVATVDREAHKHAKEPWESNVQGWGMAALERAVEEAIRVAG